jgi:hypothetical protein
VVEESEPAVMQLPTPSLQTKFDLPDLSTLSALSESDLLSLRDPEIPRSVEEVSADAAELSAAGEFRRKRKLLRQVGLKSMSGYVSMPGALSSADRDVFHQGKYDMGSLYQAQLETDQYCMVVDFYNGRIIFSNALCENLFETMAPLAQRDITSLILEEDKLNFSAAVMYLSIGKFSVMEPQRLRVNTAKGVQSAWISASQLADPLWKVDICLLDEDELNDV